MLQRRALLLAIFFVCPLSSHSVWAQGPCSSTTTTNKVACTVPQLYGPQGLVFNPSKGPLFSAAFSGNNLQGSFSQDLSPLNSAMATQLSFLPLVSPSAGITLTFDKSLGVYVLSSDSFAPVFSESGRTIGKKRLAVGFSYQYSDFNSLDGVNLKSFPSVYLRADQPGVVLFPSPYTCSIHAPSPSPVNTGFCGLIRDYITATNQIDLTVNQYSTFVTFGLTDRIDLSAAIPVLSVRMNATSSAVITQQSLSGATLFLGGTPAPPFIGCTQVLANEGGLPPPGICTTKNFSNKNSASGIGDVTLRAKGTVMKGERTALAVGLDFRVPTGDATNFLGSGAFGIKPFAVWSYSGRISPHFNVGYGWNGKSLLAGDVVTGTKSHLPSEVFYSAGVEASVFRRLTATFDLIGQRLFNAQRVELSSVATPGACDTPPGFDEPHDPSHPIGCQQPLAAGQALSLTQASGSYGMTNAGVGLRFVPFGRLLITANVQFKLDDGGLRAKYLPAISATYTFR